MTQKIEIDYRNIRVQKITLVNEGNYLEIFNYKDSDGPTSIFEKLIITEDMFSSVLTAKLVISDTSALIEQLRLSGWEAVLIEVVWLDNTIPTFKKYEFGITDVSVKENQVERKVMGPAGNKTTAVLSLVSDLFTIDNLYPQLQDEFMGKIAKGNANYPDPEDAKLEGFVDSIAKRIPTILEVGKEWKIDGTQNDIWVKMEPMMYPMGKSSNPPRFLELMNYITEYACDSSNKNAVNFLFWEDLQYVNFRSIESLIKEQKNKPTKTYYGMFTNADKYSILTLNIISDFNALKLLYNGALFSEYMRIVPDWENPYFYFMDNADMFKREWISWNYDSEGINTKWEKIEKYVPIAEDLLSDINEIRQYNTNRKTDSIYGFFEPGSYLNKSSRWWDFWDPSYSGFTGEKNFSNNKNLSKSNFAKRQLFVEEPHILKPIRTTQKLWQAQFDMMDLPISYLKKILTEIKWPLSLNRFKYAEAKKNKIKWDIWKEKICCERKVPSTFFAIITDATKIFGPTGGICGNSGPLVNGSSNLTGTTAGIPCYDYFDNASIWAYNWSEVELWPTSEVEAIKGTTLMYFYFFDKDQRSNDITLQYSATNPNTNSKFPFVFVVPPGGLSGTITTGLIKDSRMTPNEIKWQKDTRAYNIRELLNSNFYGKTSGETYAATMLGTAVSAFGKLSEINRADVTNYPEHYSMLPVGKFLLAKERQEPINFFSPYIKFGEQKGNPDDVGNTGDFYFHGALVQMYSIPASTISGMTLMGLQSTVKIQEENYNIKTNTITKTTKSKKERVKYFKNDYLFVFDAPNNHAGICRCNL